MTTLSPPRAGLRVRDARIRARERLGRGHSYVPGYRDKPQRIMLAVADGAMTIREIQTATHISSTSVIWNHIWKRDGLVAKGWLRADVEKAASIRPGPRFGGVLVNRRTGERRVLEVLGEISPEMEAGHA